MIKQDFVRRTGVRGRMLIIAMALLAPLTGAAIASPASAIEPTGEFTIFNQCPRFTPEVTDCIHTMAADGELTIDKLTVPTTNPITIQYGFSGAGSNIHVVGALNGETLSPTPQQVPGGLSSVIDCKEIKGKRLPAMLRGLCQRIVNHTRDNAVNLIVELARPASEIYFNTGNELFKSGVALGLPVKIRLENPLLGNHCYIGSSSDPISFGLGTGTTAPPPPNQPISGKVGEVNFNEEFTITQVTHQTEVDNTFSAPVAKGCGGPLAFLIDPLINSKIGLPAPSGHNTVIYNDIAQYDSNVNYVIASEQ